MLIDGIATKTRLFLRPHAVRPPRCSEGERVRTGERIGEVGKTGNARSEFCQLHFELWPHGYHDGGPVDPAPLLRRLGRASPEQRVAWPPMSSRAASGRGAAAETREYGRSAGLLTIALGTAGLLAYAFFAVSSHTLDKRRVRRRSSSSGRSNFIVAATLFRPIEQLLSRTLAEHDEIGEGSAATCCGSRP